MTDGCLTCRCPGFFPGDRRLGFQTDIPGAPGANPGGEFYYTPSSTYPGAGQWWFLFDVHNTLVDNDRIEEDLRQRVADSGKPSISDILLPA